jgi:hypothetical protein
MDFLVTPRHRWVYVALFFVMAASLINTYASLSFNIQNVYFNILYSISKYKLTSFKFVLWLSLMLESNKKFYALHNGHKQEAGHGTYISLT